MYTRDEKLTMIRLKRWKNFSCRARNTEGSEPFSASEIRTDVITVANGKREGRKGEQIFAFHADRV